MWIKNTGNPVLPNMLKCIIFDIDCYNLLIEIIVKMEEHIVELQETYPYLNIEKLEEEDPFVLDGEIPEVYTSYKVSNFSGNTNVTILIFDEEEALELKKVLELKPEILDEFIGVKYNDKYQIILQSVNPRFPNFVLKRKPFDISLNYFKNEMKINIFLSNDLLPAIFFKNKLTPNSVQKSTIVIEIENFKRLSPEGLNIDLRNILNSVLFDIEYSFNVSLEMLELSSINKRIPTIRRPISDRPEKEINFTYKKYIPELIQYFHLAEKVDLAPFKYLCYFHIIEYFADRSAYFNVAEQVKNLLLKPDFHLKVDNYVNQAINIFKKENEKHLTDKIKLNRVLQQFVSLDEFKDYLISIQQFDYFQKEQVFQFSKTLKIPGIDFSNESNFLNTLTNRIYTIRCSIVHSNPDFDESKAIPFAHTSENLEKLYFELALVYDISKNIILKSSETK